MFSFFLGKEQQEVQEVLSRYMDHDYFGHFRYGQRREPRSAFCQPAWLIPVFDADKPDIDAAVPLITKDICREGLSVIHQMPISCRRMLIVLGTDPRWDFLSCSLEHTTPVGLGYFQTGVHPERLIHPLTDVMYRLNARAAALQAPASPAGKSVVVSGL